MSTLDPSTGLTCVTCRLVFKTPDVQREHYRTDWHRYNMKRQLADLPPVSDEQFRDKVLTFKVEKETTKKEDDDVSALYCSVCKKHMNSRNAFENHIVSNKHKEMEIREPKGPKQPRKKASNLPKTPETIEADVEDDDSSGWETDEGNDDEMELEYNEAEALPMTSCLFCPQSKSSKDEMLEHMNFHHGFSIPDKKYISDEAGLLIYLGLKVGAGRCCLFCPDRRSRFATIQSCQAHMRDKEHCKLRRDPESMLEYADFYDYSSMYEQEEESASDVFYDDGWSLKLPSGARIGHRSLVQFYKQYLSPVDNTRRDAAKIAIDRANGQLLALGWTGSTSVVEAKKIARDRKYLERHRRRFDLRVACWSSKLFRTRGRVGDN